MPKLFCQPFGAGFVLWVLYEIRIDTKLRMVYSYYMVIKIKIKDRTVELVLQEGKRVLDTHKFPDEFRLSEELLPEIDKLIKRNKLEPKDIKKITVKSDLGENFTTCRIAKAVANAWNWADCG